MKHKRYILLLFLFSLVLLSGCDDSLRFKIRYATISGLTQGAPLYFQQNEIGKVTDVRYTEQGDYLVGVAIDKAFYHTATTDSHFYIGKAPDSSQTLAIIVVQDKAGGTAIDKNSIVAGEHYPDFFNGLASILSQKGREAELQITQVMDEINTILHETSSQLNQEMKTTLQTINNQLQQFSQEIEDLPNHEEVIQFKESLTELGKELQTAQQDVQTHIETVILPNIKKQLDTLQQRFQKEGRDKDVQEIDDMQKQIDTMIRI